MDDLFDNAEDDFFSLDSATAGDGEDYFLLPRTRRRRLYSPPPAPSSLRHDSLFFVSFAWWKEAMADCLKGEDAEGVLYMASSHGAECESGSDIVMRLDRQEENDVDNEKAEGFSGREYALVSESMWFKALKWHSDYCTTIKDTRCSLAAEDNEDNVFPIQIRLYMIRHSKSVVAKICHMDNPVRIFERACQIFDLKSGLLRIWDFSGQITELFEGGAAMIPNDCLQPADEEVLLEIQVYRLPDLSKNTEMRKYENMFGKRPRPEGSFDSCSFRMNGTIGHESSFSFQSYGRGNSEGFLLGLTGLINLGNTCFMNSAIQCLAHTPKLVDYFLGNYKKEINYENPLGMNGELALAFGDLLRKLWVPGRMPVAPRLFKSTLDSFAPQFSGYSQHDSQEVLAFLLDGLHEDLNRVKCKPYIEVSDAQGCPDDQVADEYWQNHHLARNNSIIVDLCHGQYRSTLVCPVCKRVSMTFDPFMYLSLPLPSTTMRTMTITVLGTNGSIMPSSFTVAVPKCGRCKDLIQAISVACSLGDDENILVAEVYNHCIIRFLEDPSDSLALIRDDDRLVAYRLPQENEGCQLVVFMHQHIERYSVYGLARSSWRLFGIPLVTKIPGLVSGSQIHNEYRKLLHPFLKDEGGYGDDRDSDNGFAKMDCTSTSSSDDSLNSDDEVGTSLCFRIHFSDDRGIMKRGRIKLNEPLYVPVASKKLNLLVRWSGRMMKQYDTSRLNSLPEICRPGSPASRSQESVSLYRCLEGFLKEEPLGPDDMWYCPGCKKHRQASKKLDLWRLPEILVVHLKRFSYSRFLKNKLETYVDFPIEKLDLSGFLARKNGSLSNCYGLYAIINHYGSMGGGHYTAVVYHGNRRFEFNDSIVEPVGEDNIKTSAAYVLFYRRIPNADA